MQFGVSGKNRIHINDAREGETYYCPLCNGELIQKCGTSRISHFAHKTNDDCEMWSSDMSDWHCNWQSQFLPDSQECVITYNGVKHRADVGLKKTVIEFQNSPISSDEFQERNRFYTSAGYRVIWLFNLMEEYDKGHISDDVEEYKFVWKWASHTFENFHPGNRKIELYFQFCEPEDEYSCILGKVIWASPDHGFKYFMTEEWISKSKFVEETMGRPLSDLWASHKNIKYGIFFNTINGYEFFVDRSPAYMKGHGGVKGRRVLYGRFQDDEKDIYYWWAPQWKARNVEYYM